MRIEMTMTAAESRVQVEPSVAPVVIANTLSLSRFTLSSD